jgi:nicotinamide mononucleotide transporter
VDWLIKNHFEIVGTISGLIYLYFSLKQKIWLWPLGIITSGYSVIVFYDKQLYADMTLNIYYIIVSIYGWYHWLIRKDNTHHSSIKISVLTISNWIEYLLIVGVLTLIIAYILLNFPQKIGLIPSALPWWDSFLFSGSILATWMLARKVLEQWLWWIVIDAISIGVFIYKELYIFSGLFLVYTIMAIIGYISWKKDWKKQ